MKTEELEKKICEIIAPYVSAWGEDERIAEALIAAGIGDVKEAEAEANRYEMLYKLQNRDMALAERRAHDAEHRAARAERALRIFAKNCSCADCPFFGGCQIIPDVEDDFSCCFDMYLAIAEKELAEEEKDGNETD